MNEKELATVLAALRHWQETTLENERICYPHFLPCSQEIKPMTDDEIDLLCEDLNCKPDNHIGIKERIASIIFDYEGDEYVRPNETDSHIIAEQIMGSFDNTQDCVPICKSMDWELLRKQKSELLERIDDSDLLMGIVHMIDDIQDHAVDVWGYENGLVFG